MTVAYGESVVNGYRVNNQQASNVAVLADGSYVVAWQSYNQDSTNTWGIYTQRFSSSGIAVGPELRVNTTVLGNQDDVHIAALSTGGYVLTWTDDDDGSSQGIFGQRIDANGVPQGAQFLVNTTTSSEQYYSSVASYSGGFAVVWSSGQAGGSGYDIYLKRFDDNGVETLAETRISTVPGQPGSAQGGTQYEPEVAADANGNLVMVWTDQGGNDTSSYGVYGRLFSSTGAGLSSTFLVNTFTSGAQYEPDVAVLGGGGFVVVWRSDAQDGSSAGVYAQRFIAAGAIDGAEFRVNVSTTGGQYQPDVAALPDGGFVVTWYSDNYDVGGTGASSDVYAREYDAAGVATTGQQKLISGTNSTEHEPSVASLGNGNYVVSYSDYDAVNGAYDVAHQLFGSTATLPRQGNPTVGDFNTTVTFAENAVNAALQVLDAAVSVADADSANFDGGRIDLYYLRGGAGSDQLGVRHQGMGFGQIGVAGNTISFSGTAIGSIAPGTGVADSNLRIDLNANATVDAVEALIQNLGYRSTSSSPAAQLTVGLRVADGDGGSVFAGAMDINVTPELDGRPLAWGEERVNSYSANQQQEPEIAVLTDGSYVITWQSEGQDGSATGSYFQRFAANGTALGGEQRANSATVNDQSYPHAAALSDGGFVITWQDNSGLDGSGWGITAQRYNASGVAQGANFVVNTHTGNSQYHDAVASYTGGFAVVWASTTNADGNAFDIYLERYDNAGVQVLAETRICAVPGAPGTAQVGTQELPDIAARSDGSLVIVWQDNGGNDGNSNGVYGRTVSAGGVLSDTFLVNTFTAGAQYEPSVATLSDGGFVVVWRSDNQDGNSAGVYGQRFDAAAAKVGGEFLVNESTSGGQYQPAVTAMSGGGFVVTWYNDNYDLSGAGSYGDVYIREYNAAGVAIDGQRRLAMVTNAPSNVEYQAAIADLGNGNFVVAYADYVPANDGGNATYEITQQIFGSGAALARQASPTLGDFTGTVTFAENLVNATPQLIDSAVSLSDPDSANFDGGRLDLFYVQGGEAADQLGVRHQGNGAGQIGVAGNTVSYGGTAIGTLSGGSNGTNLGISFVPGATVSAVEALVQNLTYASTSSNPALQRTVGLRISDGDGGSSAASTVTINVTPELDGRPLAWGEERVNSYSANDQNEPEIAVLADGSYVITWQSEGQDGSATGSYFQRFAANGTALGSEQRANSGIVNDQSYPHAAALSDGGFVITWQDQSGLDGSGWGITAQRYNASGVAQGANFVVNTTTSSAQFHDAVAGYIGGFAVVWTSTSNAGGNGFDIYLKRYDNAGNQVLAETRISTVPGAPASAQVGTQEVPDIAARSDGSLVIVWQDSNGNDSSSNGVYGRTISAAGALSDTFLVNTFTTGAQNEPSVATLGDGGFVVVWRSDNQDGNGAGVYGQRFDAAAAKIGAEFLVNESTNGGQYLPAVTAMSGGGFVVTWFNDNYDLSGAGSYQDVYIREYNAAGVAIDGQRKLAMVTNTPSNQEYQPAIADLGNGNFVVAYADHVPANDGGNATYEITQQIFGSGAALARQASPTLGDFTGTVTFAENLVNATPQLIDSAVSLSDPDSANFDGGRLDLFYVQGGEAADQLGVRHQGSGAGQIGVAGNTVSYGGTAIGTLSGGSNGTNLGISFVAGATVSAVEALVQNLTYASTSSNPALQRTVGLRISDGEGGASAASTVTINVTPELDGRPLAWGEERVNSYSANDQNEPEIAVLADGSYVITWQSEGQDGSSTGTYFQRFAANGTALGGEQRANTGNLNQQEYPHIAALSDGGFVITWQDQSGLDGSGWGITAQRYNASGVAQGANFVVNTFSPNSQYHDAVAGYTGGFAVVWSSNHSGGNTDDIDLKRYDNAGGVVLAETRISTVPGAPGTAQGGLQLAPDIAARSDGSLVIVWQDTNGNDGSSNGVYGRTVSAGGVLGDTFLVNTNTSGAQHEPSVATLSDGGFVVVWRSDNQDGNSAGVYGKRFDAAAAKVGGEFLINESTNGGQYQPAVTAMSGGGFVVTWFNDSYDLSGTGSYQDVYIREYNAAGVAIDGQRKLAMVTNTPSNVEYQPAIADLGNGNFVVAYADHVPANDGGNSTYEITQQIFGSGAALARGANPVIGDLGPLRTLSSTVASPLYTGNPLPIDPDVSVSDADSNNFDTGQLTITLANGATATEALAVRNQGAAAGQIGVAGANVTFGGVTIGSISGGGVGVSSLVVTLNASADAVAVRALIENITYQNTAPPGGTTDRYISFRLTDGDGGVSLPEDVQLRIQVTVTPATVALDDVVSTLNIGESQANAGVLVDDAVQLAYSGAGSFNNGKLTVSYLSSTARVDDQLAIRNEGNGAGQVGVTGNSISFGGVAIGTVSATLTGANGTTLEITFNASATEQAVERVIENLRYSNHAEGPNPTRTLRIVLTDSNAAASTARDVVVNISAEADPAAAVPLSGDMQVNSYEAGAQTASAVARLFGANDGGYVIAWVGQDAQDGSGYSVQAQRFDGNGAAQGAEILVNTFTQGNQHEPALAGLANGGFVVAWRSDGQDGGGTGVYAQRYDANGQEAGTEFRVNATTAASQYQPAVVSLSDGSFVIAYFSDYSNAAGNNVYDVMARRYATDGTAIGGEFTINSSPSGTQSQPQLASLEGGGFVATYSDSSGTDGSGYGIVAQRFDNAGAKVGGEIAVNTTTTGNQVGPDVAALVGGGFVIAYESGDTILAQRFGAAGAKLGGEIVVTTVDAAANYSDCARVAALGNGGFVVAWDNNGALIGSGYDALAQQFDASGNRVDGVFALNRQLANAQIEPDLVGLAGNNFVASWSGYDQERATANTYGVYQRLFGAAGSITGSEAPVLVDVAAHVSFAENDVNAAPQLLDGSVGLSDADSANFAGGRLWVSVISSYDDNGDQQLADTLRVQDNIALRNQGGGAGQVGVSGSNVSYGGVPIGTIVLNGQNGNDLVLLFNTNASSDAVEAVIENLTYRNTFSAPGAARIVSVSVSDGDGATSAPRLIAVNVTPQADGPQPLFGNEIVNTYRADTQDEASTAALSGGGYVVVWSSAGQDGSGTGVFGQRFTAAGERVGAEFEVNTQTLRAQNAPVVAGLNGGAFVVAWVSSGQDGSSNGVYAQRFASDGQPAGSEFRVNTSTPNGQQQPAIAATSDGGFVVAWYNDYYNAAFTEVHDVFFQRYDADGVALGGETRASPAGQGTNSFQSEPTLTALLGGGFVVIWTESGSVGNDGNGYSLNGQRFTAAGVANGPVFQVNTYVASNQHEPDVVGLAGGGFVAVWRSEGQDGNSAGVFAQRFDANANKLGAEFRVNTDIQGNEYQPSVTALASGGFAVAWNDDSRTYVQQFAADGTRIDGDTRVDTVDNNSNANLPDVVGLSGGGFVVAWRDYDYGIASYEVYQQLFGDPALVTRQARPVLTDLSSSVSFTENLVNATPQLIDVSVDLSDADSPNFAGGQLWVSVLSAYGDISNAQLPELIRAQDQLGIRNVGNGPGQVGVAGGNVSVGGVWVGTIAVNGVNGVDGADLVVTFNADANEAAVEAVIESLTYANTSSTPLASRAVSVGVSDGDGGTSEPRVVTINVTPQADAARPLFGNEVVNTYHPDTQAHAAIAGLSDGGYLVVWDSEGQDGWSAGVYGQRFAANGVPVGSEFQVNSYTPYPQSTPSSSGLSNGGYVIVWQSQHQDGSGYSIFAQRFDADGITVGDEFLVNTRTDYDQASADIAALSAGGFVAVWSSYYSDGTYYDIRAQRFDGNGAKTGPEFKVNTSAGFPGSSQYEPAVASFADGSFVIVYRSDDQDGSGAGVFGQRFDATGATVGTEFKANTYTEGSQYEPDVAALTGGGFVVVWRSDGQDGSGGGVFGQRYDASGSTLGNEFRVNTEATGNEAQPAVTALSHGGFAVTYYDSARISVQQFSADGLCLDAEYLVDTHDANGNGSLPAIRSLAHGAFVVAWQDYDYAISNYQVFQQFFGDSAQVTRQANPDLVDVAPSVTFAENSINLLPRVIDPGVGLYDPDSASFDGGLLEVNYLTDYGAQDQLGLQGLDHQDQLGIRHEGNGLGQVGVSGSTVSFGGVAIGTIVGNGANGDKLSVRFNANASVDAVEQVIENLTYANTVSNPIASRTISIRVTDGDGGASQARSVTINVTPEIDGATRLGQEHTVNATRNGYQVQPDVARLADGGYVVVWEDQAGNDSSGYGVYGQRYDASDNAVGGQFKANTYVTGNQHEAMVTGLSGGGFVLTWRSDGQDGGGTGVYAQRYGSDGSPAGAEFRVNTTTGHNRYQPSITATADGGFVIAWYYDYYNLPLFTELGDIFFQRYDALGIAQGGETRANPAGAGTIYQSEPAISAFAAGGFVIVWTDASQDGDSYGIFGQRFDAAGAAVGPSFAVNTFRATQQQAASVATLNDGGFVVAWQSHAQDLSGWGIHSQRFDSAGVKVGAEFRVNTSISGSQYQVDVTALNNGGWVVAWYNDATGDVYMQQYNAAGAAIDGETLVNTYTYSTQQQPAIASLPEGGFVVTWAGYVANADGDGDGAPDGGNDSYEIKLQRYSHAAPSGQTITGTSGPDTLSGQSTNDTVRGLEGSDRLSGGAGNDSLDGGSGNYDWLAGGDGDDTLDGGATSDDTYNIDIAIYEGSAPVSANLQLGSASQGGFTDTLIRIDAIFSGSGADSLRGADGPATQRGETLRGAGGNDTLDGGTGVDAAEFSGPRSQYMVTKLNDTTWTVRDNDTSNGDEGTDTLANIERIVFADQMLSIGSRAEELARVAFVLWSPAIVGSATLFSRGLSFYDVGYDLATMSVVALQFWTGDNDTRLAQRLIENSGSAKTVAQLLSTIAANGGANSPEGRAAALREIALDAATTLRIEESNIRTVGLVSDNSVPGFGTLFDLLPGG